MYIADWFNTRLNHSVTRRIFWKKKVLEEINFKTQGQAMFFLAHPFVITVYTVFSVFLSKNYLSQVQWQLTKKWGKINLNLCALIQAVRMKLWSKYNFLVFNFLFIKWKTKSLS